MSAVKKQRGTSVINYVLGLVLIIVGASGDSPISDFVMIAGIMIIISSAILRYGVIEQKTKVLTNNKFENNDYQNLIVTDVEDVEKLIEDEKGEGEEIPSDIQYVSNSENRHQTSMFNHGLVYRQWDKKRGLFYIIDLKEPDNYDWRRFPIGNYHHLIQIQLIKLLEVRIAPIVILTEEQDFFSKKSGQVEKITVKNALTVTIPRIKYNPAIISVIEKIVLYSYLVINKRLISLLPDDNKA